MYEFIAYLVKSLLSGILLLLYYWFVLRNTSLYYLTQAGQNFTPGKSWLMGYFVIRAALMLTLLIRVIGIYKLKDRFPKTPGDGFTLFETSLDAAPFSFFKNVFWKKGISLNVSDGKRILRHELAHIAGKHTYDKLFMQLIVCVFWINPLYWIIQKELILLLFTADTDISTHPIRFFIHR